MPDLRRIASPCPPAPCSAPSFAHTPTRATPSTPPAVAQLTHVPDTTGGRLHAALGVRVGERVKKKGRKLRPSSFEWARASRHTERCLPITSHGLTSGSSLFRATLRRSATGPECSPTPAAKYPPARR